VTLPWPFDREYMQLALGAGVIVGAIAPTIGTFLVQRRMALMGDGIGHVAFAGVAGGLLLGVWPVWTALVLSVAAALAMERLRLRARASGDVALALFFYSGIAAGVVLVGLAGSLDASLFSYLFGSVLTVDRRELVAVACLGGVVATAIALTRRGLFGLVTDEEWSAVAGVPVSALNGLLVVLAAVTVVASMRVVGLLLVAALMVLPVACAQLVARSFRATLRAAVAFGVGSVIAGLGAARAWGLAPGGTVVLVSASMFAVLALVRSRRRRPAILGA
jgi:zinc transport system permease protein